MAAYDFSVLSPLDFEELVRDLLQAEENIRLESFGPGRDLGIDFRFASPTGSALVVQAKHYPSGFDSLLTAARREDAKVLALKPGRYILATSVSLSPERKNKLIAALPSAPLAPGDILGREDLNNLLGRHPTIERQHLKLWLAGTAVLERIVHSGLYNRTEAELEEVDRIVPRFVDNKSVPKALAILETQGSLVVSGEPGVGKSTLARMLIWAHAHDGWQITVIDDISDAFTLKHGDEPQLVFFDDFLGQVALTPDWIRTVDQRLPPFLRRARTSPNLRFVMTTRDYILNQARQRSDKLGSPDLRLSEFVLNVGAYTRSVRARILFNHIFFSDLGEADRQALLADDFYLRIINHRNYNPRLISLLTSREFLAINPQPVRELVVAVLDDPSVLWDKPYRQHIDQDGRALMLAVLFNSPQVLRLTLEASFARICAALGYPTSKADLKARFRASLQALEGSVLAIEGQIVRFGNPGVRDFLQRAVAADGQVLAIVEKLETFDEVGPAWEIWRTSPGLLHTPESRAAWARAAEAMAESGWGSQLERLALTMDMTPAFGEADAHRLTSRVLDDLHAGEVEGEEAEVLVSMLDDLEFSTPVSSLGERTRQVLSLRATEMLEQYGAALTLETLESVARALRDHGADEDASIEAARAGLTLYLENISDVLAEIDTFNDLDSFESDLRSAMADWGATYAYLDSAFEDRRERLEVREARAYHGGGGGGGGRHRSSCDDISDDAIRNMFGALK